VELDWPARRAVMDGLKGAVGLTPVVRLSRITPGTKVRIPARLE
jgi:hypothetical protein